MKRWIMLSLALALILLVSSCKGKETETQTTEDGLQVYAATMESVYAHGHYDYENLLLEETPLFTDKDIRSYFWESHEIVFTNEFIRRKRENQSFESYVTNELGIRIFPSGGSRLLGMLQFDCFVVVLNGEKIYSGTFPTGRNMPSQNMRLYIGDISDSAVRIGTDSGYAQIRDDDRLYEFFRKQNKLQLNNVEELNTRISYLEGQIESLVNQRESIFAENEFLNQRIRSLNNENSAFGAKESWYMERLRWYMMEAQEPENLFTYSNILMAYDFKDVSTITKAANAYRSIAGSRGYENDRMFHIFETYYHSMIARINGRHMDEAAEDLGVIASLNGIRLIAEDRIIYATPATGYLKREFGNYLTTATNAYLDLLDSEALLLEDKETHALIFEGTLQISLEQLSELIAGHGEYLRDYPYNYPYYYKARRRAEKLMDIYLGKERTDTVFLFGINVLSDEAQESYAGFIQRYRHLPYAEIVQEYYTLLESKDFRRDEDVERFLRNLKY